MPPRHAGIPEALGVPPESLEAYLKVHRPEVPQELRSRLERERADAAHERWRGSILFGAAILGVGVVVAVCVLIAVGGSSSPDDKKWATAILGSIVTGAVGYLGGKASR